MGTVSGTTEDRPAISTRRIYYRELHGYKYELMSDYFTQTGLSLDRSIATPFIELHCGGALVVKAGYAWDGPSGAIDSKNFMRASLVHDALYQLMRRGLLSADHRAEADRLLYDFCLADGMSKISASMAYWFVRTFGAKSIKHDSGIQNPILRAPE